MSAGKMKITFEIIVNIEELAHYEASTLEEAVKNQEQWLKDGTADPVDFLVGGDEFIVKCEVHHD